MKCTRLLLAGAVAEDMGAVLVEVLVEVELSDEDGDEFVEVLLLKNSAISGELKPFEGVFVCAFPFALDVQISIYLIIVE